MAHLTLLGQLLRRDIQERYHGTALGMAWLLLQPLALLLVYTLVFGEILQVRQGIAHEKVSHFAFYLLAGLGMFNALADVLVRAPLLLTEKRDWLLHSSLPAYLLPLVPVGTSILLESLLVGLLLLGMLFTVLAKFVILPAVFSGKGIVIIRFSLFAGGFRCILTRFTADHSAVIDGIAANLADFISA